MAEHTDTEHTDDSFALSKDRLDVAALNAALGDETAGACVVFEGRVRNHNEGKKVQSLEYEAYDRMANEEGHRIIEEASSRFDIIAARCIHRIGHLRIGDTAVWVAVLAAHRTAAFSACSYIIDEVKSRVPIWKKEHYPEGSSEWIAPVQRSEPS